MASCSPVPFFSTSFPCIPSLGIPVLQLLSARVREVLVGTSSDRSYRSPDILVRKELKWLYFAQQGLRDLWTLTERQEPMAQQEDPRESRAWTVRR